MFVSVPPYRLPDFQKNKNIAAPDAFISDGPLVWRSERLGVEITVPKNTHTNFASLSWYVRPFIKINDRHRAASALHDYLYDMLGMVSASLTLTRDQCDLEMMDAMKALHVNRFILKIIIKGLKIGGFTGWNRSKKSTAANYRRYLARKRYAGK